MTACREVNLHEYSPRSRLKIVFYWAYSRNQVTNFVLQQSLERYARRRQFHSLFRLGHGCLADCQVRTCMIASEVLDGLMVGPAVERTEYHKAYTGL